MISTQYKGFTIIFDEYDEHWGVEGDNRSNKTFLKFKAVKDYIDSIKGREFKRFDAIYRDWRDYKIVTVTSITEDNLEAWFTREDSKRGKAKIKELFELSPANEEIIRQMADIETQRGELSKKVDELANQMTNIKV